MGLRLPEGIEVRMVEESTDTINLVLPSASAVGEYGEPSDQELEAVAGGQASWDEPCDADTSPFPTQPITCGL
jgi:hypothetical protein